MLEERPAGFTGGMTAKKYMAIAKTSKANATRDLQT
ncbi:Fic family protein [Pedobacter sp. CG_S7]